MNKDYLRDKSQESIQEQRLGLFQIKLTESDFVTTMVCVILNKDFLSNYFTRVFVQAKLSHHVRSSHGNSDIHYPESLMTLFS